MIHHVREWQNWLNPRENFEEVCVFYLKNRGAKNMSCGSNRMYKNWKNIDNPKYLDVYLEQNLTYKAYGKEIKQ